VEQRVYFVEKQGKRGLLLKLLEEPSMDRVLVFSRTKHGANRITKFLDQAGVRAAAIHGNKSQSARTRALEGFRDRKLSVLVATDIAARGIDIDGISHVVNFDVPNVPETYVHRIGRTGRAGASGVALSFCESAELPHLSGIERLLGHRLDRANEAPSATHNGSHSEPRGERRGRAEQPRNPGSKPRGRRPGRGRGGAGRSRGARGAASRS
jgi:ATP-dependent RNA helicase RhlE